ncbi:MAG: SusD/RagB family nutrient-binding outer membrane lipoprotein [Tannerellaceae bacterium]|nr:SusD/RagB family nutrient-binding outer membrane lipoprotein [Tannerellaceae bacterium]
MKKILFRLFAFAIILNLFASCEDMDNINLDPNNPKDMPSNMLMAGAEKHLMDYIYDAWFSGRQCLLYAQFWAQRNYTEEDRYQIRESVNNSYFNHLYRGIAALEEVIKLNTDKETASSMLQYGYNDNQIAAAKTLRAWAYLLMTDTWGGIPYGEVNKLKDGVYYPKYESQVNIYNALLNELKTADELFDLKESAFEGGDNIFGGDAGKWKKFANSLRCRIAIHIAKVDPKWKSIIADALNSGVFESNDDNALYHYSTTAPYECYFYRAFFADGRNDFSIARPFVDILKGVRDTLNNKQHPFEGIVDPRLAIFTTPRNGEYIGMPYGIPSGQTSVPRGLAPNWFTAPPAFLIPNYDVTLMTYAEMQFIISEYKGFAEEEYKNGVRASLNYWGKLNGGFSGEDIEEYVESVSKNVNAEAVSLQKYIDLFNNGTEAWTEYRRTGFPLQLLKPNEISFVEESGNEIRFIPLSETKGDILARVKYPTNESTLNAPNWDEALSRLEDKTNNYYSKMFWDVRSASNPHPANK